MTAQPLRKVRARGARRACVGGCGRPVRGWRYCKACRERMRNGVPLDHREFPTIADLRRVREAARRNLPPASFALPGSRAP